MTNNDHTVLGLRQLVEAPAPRQGGSMEGQLCPDHLLQARHLPEKVSTCIAASQQPSTVSECVWEREGGRRMAKIANGLKGSDVMVY